MERAFKNPQCGGVLGEVQAPQTAQNDPKHEAMNQTSDYYEERIQELVNRIQELEEALQITNNSLKEMQYSLDDVRELERQRAQDGMTNAAEIAKLQ